VRSSGVRVAKAAELMDVATRLGRESLFGSVRFAIDSILLERWKLSLGSDSSTAALRARATQLRGQAQGALLSVGPRRMLADLALADSLTGQAMALSPRSAVPLNARASLGAFTGFMLLVVKQFFPDSTWVPAAVPRLEEALPFATAAIAKAPTSADARFTRAQIYLYLLTATQQTKWRDSALADLRAASSLAGGRADIWSLRATTENSAGLPRDALFSSQQGQEADHLFTNARELLYAQGLAQLQLLQEENALQSCRTGATQFPDDVYFIDCEGDVLGRLSRDPRAAHHVLALADSLQVLKLPDMAAITPEELRLFAAAILERAGLHDQAAHVYDSVTSKWGKAVDPILILDAAYVRQEHGDLDSALALAARAARQDSTTVVALERDPWYQRMRQQPGFQAAMQGVPPAGGR
jgi:tetratricopeptide (TPR) repeat protein